MIELTTIEDLCRYLLGIESNVRKNLCENGNSSGMSYRCFFLYVCLNLLNVFSLGFRALANFRQSAQYAVEIAEVEQHGRVEKIGLPQLQFLVTGA